MPSLQTVESPSRRRRTRKVVPGVLRDDSDDELGDVDHPWQWIYSATSGPETDEGEEPLPKRKRSVAEQNIVGARMGNFECRLGDTVLLKAEGSHEAWVGIICGFIDDDSDDGEMSAYFMWFSTEKEIRNKVKKRTDFMPNELYISPSWDVNPLASINGKANVMSAAVFRERFPTGHISRNSKHFGKTFMCRRGCNTRTASYTDEFVWEDIYTGTVDDLERLIELVKTGTKATRKRRQNRGESADPHDEYKPAPAEAGDNEKQPRTPKKRKTSADAATTPSGKQAGLPKALTPAHMRTKVKKHLEFTPLATRTLSPSHYQSSPFQQARAQLHVSSVPATLPCREAEFRQVYRYLEEAITDGDGACIYISGTPGTGKTATVREVVSNLHYAVECEELDDFIFVEINGLKVTDPHQAYSLLWQALKDQRVSPSQAFDLLAHEFSRPNPRRIPCVVLMDELDQLVTKNQSVMYNFFNWPNMAHSRLIVIAVANTMDLPERTLSNKISSRLGMTRVFFPGYNHEQLMTIIQSRLEGVPGGIVDPDAIQFASRKVAAVSGDARRALDMCRRAVEIAEAESLQQLKADDMPPTPSKTHKANEPGQDGQKKKKKAGRVTIDTIRRAIAEVTSNPLQQYLRTLPFSSRLLLAALSARVRRTGLGESTFGDVLEETQRALRYSVSISVGTNEGRPLEALLLAGNRSGTDDATSRQRAAATAAANFARLAGISHAAVDLAAAGIIYLEGRKAERPSKMRFAVSEDDIALALRHDPEVKAAGLALQSS